MSGKITKIKDWREYVTFAANHKGIIIDDSMPIEAYCEAAADIGGMVADGLWALGDLFTWGERVLGESYAQPIDMLKYSEKTVKDATWVSGIFPPSRRHAALTFNHHKIVAGLEPKDREELLHQSEINEWSTRELTEEKKKKFPSTKKPGKAKKKADAPAEGEASEESAKTLPEEKAVKVTQEEAIEHLDLSIAFFEALDPKTTFLPETHAKFAARFKALRRHARRHGMLGTN